MLLLLFDGAFTQSPYIIFFSFSLRIIIRIRSSAASFILSHFSHHNTFSSPNLRFIFFYSLSIPFHKPLSLFLPGDCRFNPSHKIEPYYHYYYRSDFRFGSIPLFPPIMGNISSGGGGSSRRRSISSRRARPPPQLPVNTLPEITANPFVYPGATPPYPPPHQYPPNSNAPMHYPQYHYPADYPPVPPVPFPHHHPQMEHGWMEGRWYPCRPMMPQSAPLVEHQKAVTIKNDVNIKKETLKIEPDEENPGRFLVSFTFDATVSGCITILFFAKEVPGCVLKPMKEDLLAPVTVNFQPGLGQKFRQLAGTGIDFSMFQESELLEVVDMDVYPLAVKAESSSANQDVSDGTQTSGNTNSQITQAVFEKERGEFQVKVLKQILWVNEVRYELQEIYGIRNSAETDVDESDQGKECVICLSEPRDTIVHPCRHMCMCSGCAKVLRFQTNRCPICRQPVERLLQINIKPEE